MNASSRIGVDIDGVLADFNSAFIHRCIEVTGVDLFPVRPFDIPCWNYPEHYGYTAAQVSAVWADIKADPNFWYDLMEYPQTISMLAVLRDLEDAGAEIYFITARPGTEVKRQTEEWLLNMGFFEPTVLISSAKGMCARALNLTHYIDDRWENVVDVAGSHEIVDNMVVWVPSKTKTYLLTQPWNVNNNAGQMGIQRVSSVLEFVQPVEAVV